MSGHMHLAQLEDDQHKDGQMHLAQEKTIPMKTRFLGGVREMFEPAEHFVFF